MNHNANLANIRSEEHTSELQSPCNLVCRLLLEKKQHHDHYHTHHSIYLHHHHHYHDIHHPCHRQHSQQHPHHYHHHPHPQYHLIFFFFNDTATTEIYTLSLHDALPISKRILALPDLEQAKSAVLNTLT